MSDRREPLGLILGRGPDGLEEALTAALGYWKANADASRFQTREKTLDNRDNYEGRVYRRCRRVLEQAVAEREARRAGA